jgi:hypothetical protein
MDAMGREKLDSQLSLMRIVNAEEVLQQKLYLWWVSFENRGIQPTTSLGLAKHLQSFCYHGYPELTPDYQCRVPNWILSDARQNLVFECIRRHLEKRSKRLHDLVSLCRVHISRVRGLEGSYLEGNPGRGGGI